MKCFLENQKGSTELVVLGLLAALIVVLAIPLLGDVESVANKRAIEQASSVQVAP